MTKARLPQDGRHVSGRNDRFRPELRTAPEAPEAQGLAAEDDRGVCARHPPGDYFDHQIDDPSETDLLDYFTDLRETHSWSSVKLDLYGLKFHCEHVLKKPWVAPGLVKPPRTQRLPDIITVAETERILRATQVLSYRGVFFALYSLGLRLGEGSRLTVTVSPQSLDRPRQSNHNETTLVRVPRNAHNADFEEHPGRGVRPTEALGGGAPTQHEQGGHRVPGNGVAGEQACACGAACTRTDLARGIARGEVRG